MSDKSRIEWTDATWNPIRGCQKVSEGCRNCYAVRMAARFSAPGQPYEGLAEMTEHGPRWTRKIRLVPEVLEQPMMWKKPRMIFVNSMSDLFHEDVPFRYIAAVFGAMASSPHHTFQILTKRPERMMKWFNYIEYMAERISDVFPDDDYYWRQRHVLRAALISYIGSGRIESIPDPAPWPLPNVWLGVSVENQRAADERIPFLLQTPAAVRFLSCEPLLGPVYLSKFKPFDGECFCQHRPDGCKPREAIGCPESAIDWVIVGGESGPGARPMHPDWVRSIREQCKEAGVAFFFKQWGEWAPVHDLRCNEPGIKERKWYNFDPDTSVCRIGKKTAGRLLDGIEWNEMPEVRK